MAVKKKKKMVRKAFRKKERKKANARKSKKSKIVKDNEKNKQISQGDNENSVVNNESKTNYGSGEFGNTENILDRGEVIYGDENQDNAINKESIVENNAQDNEVQENNIQKDNINEDKMMLENNVQESKNILENNNIGEKVQMSLPPIPKISSRNTKSIKPAISQFTGKKLMTEKDIAMDFAIKAHKKFDRLIKASILFGSQTSAKDNAMAGSDIDVIFIIDDAAIDWDLELVSWYREELGKIVSAQSYGMELHINTVRLTTWWEDLIHGDPVVINILRYGEALIDSGFFNPIKALLLNGKIRSTPEAVYSALQRSPWHIARSKSAQLGAIEGVYWSMIDAAHAALITAGKLPPSPEHVPEMLREVFVDTGMLKMSFVKAIREIFSLHKAISHGNVSSIKGQEIDEWQDLAEKFLGEMTRIIDIMLEAKK